jgi:flagellin
MEDTTTPFSFQVGAATGTQNQITIDIKSMNTVGLGLDGGTNGVTEVTAVEAKDAYTLTKDNLSNKLNITNDIFASADVTITLTDGAGATLASVAITEAADDSVNATAITNAFTAFGVTAAGAPDPSDGSTHADGDGIKLTFTEVAAVAAVAGVSPLAAGNNISVEDTSTGSDDAGDNALASIILIDAAIKQVNVQRSELGAVSNRLNHTVNNLTNISSNLSAAKGGIEDSDFALETTNLAKNQILQQASTAMLAQANASKQNVLSLLQG